MNKPKKIQNKFNSSAATLILFMGIAIILNYNHNANFSKLTNSRDFLYESWNEVTKNGEFFKEVNNADSIVSSTSNDAFEMNAGSFYANTGIRLTYLFNAGIIWPQFSNCSNRMKCSLGGLDRRIGEIIPNLLRNPMESKINRSSNPEWVAQLIKNDKWKKGRKYYLDIIPASPDQTVVFMAEITKFEPTAMFSSTSFKMRVISKVSKLPWKPKIGFVCGREIGKPFKNANVFVSSWEIRFTQSMNDIRDLNFGICTK